MKYDDAKLRSDLQIYKSYLEETDNRHYLRNHLILRQEHRDHLQQVDSESVAGMSQEALEDFFSGKWIWSSTRASTATNLINVHGFEKFRKELSDIYRYAGSDNELTEQQWNTLFIKFVGKSWVTEILSAVDGDRFVLFNSSTVSALRHYGFKFTDDNKFRTYLRVCEYFRMICNIMSELGFEDHSMYAADGFLNYRITGWDEDTENRNWLFAPGKNAMLWEQMLNAGEMSVGWYEIGDLNGFTTKKQMENEIKARCDDDKSATSPWYFAYGIKKGDTVFVRKGLNSIIGYGKVTSDYIYRPENGEFCNIRKVDWTPVDKTPISTTGMITLSLVDKPDRLKELREACGIGTIAETKNTEDVPDKTADFWKKVLTTGDLTDRKRLDVVRCMYKAGDFTYEELGRRFDKSPDYFRNVINGWETDIEDSYPGKLLENGSIVIRTERDTRLNSAIRILLDTDEGLRGQDIREYESKYELNTVLYGPPGTGKTYNAKEMALSILDVDTDNTMLEFDRLRREGRIEFITFHQSYSYEEFMEGIRPVLDEHSSEVGYELRPGVFKELCSKAEKDFFNRYVLIIDEINRGDTAQIFGELITLLESSKRIGENEALTVRLPYSGEEFGIPNNLYVIGTMNTADRSLTSLDAAFRRRFRFVEMLPDPTVVERTVEGIKLDRLLETLNNRLESRMDRDHLIGHSYFCHVNCMKDLCDAMQYGIIPQLQEYFPSDAESMIYILSEKGDDSASFFISYKNDSDPERGYDIEHLDPDSEMTVRAFKSIYSDEKDAADNED